MDIITQLKEPLAQEHDSLAEGIKWKEAAFSICLRLISMSTASVK